MEAIFDIETDNLYDEVTHVHCISIKVDDEKVKTYTSKPMGTASAGTIEDGIKVLQEADTLIGHNIIGYDIPVLEKLYPDFTYNEVFDTLVASRLVHSNLMMLDANRKSLPPRLKGSHSLKAWGYRLRLLKGEFGAQEDAWDKLTPEMVTYCELDVAVTAKLYAKLLDKAPEKTLV